MIFQIYKRAFQALMKQPVRVLGLSLFGCLLIGLGSALFGIIPGVALSVGLLFSAALSQIYLRSYRGEQCCTQDMFKTFKDRDTLKRTLGGMAWRELWVFIWGLIPIAGIVLAIIKTYQYRLTPYILMNENDIKAMDAIQVSKERTKGYRGKMFWADVLVFVIVWAAMLILGALGRIPYVGYLFLLVLFLLLVAVCALLPLFLGLVQAAFYDEILHPSIQANPFQEPQYPQYPQYPQEPQQVWAPAPAPAPVPAAEPLYRFCPNCGTRFDANQTKYCPNCGNLME